MKRIIFICSLLFTILFSPAFAFNIAYVEVNTNNIENTTCYVRSDNQKPFFYAVSIFAGNINGDSPNAPVIYFNPNVEKVVNSDQVNNLHKHGIKVLMTLLGNHQNAGWSCMTDSTAITKFADAIVTMVNQYNLDGVDIDNEYSTCNPNNYSLVMIAQAIKQHPKFKGKWLTKALYGDYDDFSYDYNGHTLSDFLDYGWEMTYGNTDFKDRIAFYLQNGMAPDFLMIGGWTVLGNPTPFEIGQYNLLQNLAGNMVYDVTNHSQDYLNKLIKAENIRLSVQVVPNCLS